MAAMMAHQRPPEPVFDEPGGAVRALKAMAAGAAERQGRVAAPVEKQQRLLAARQRLGDGLGKAGRDPFSARGRLPAKINRRDIRRWLWR